MALGPQRRPGPVGDTDALEDVGQVRLDRPLGDAEAPGDLLVAQPAGHQQEHLALAGAELGRGRALAAVAEQDPGGLPVDRRLAVAHLADATELDYIWLLESMGFHEGQPTQLVTKTEALQRNINDPIYQEMAGNQYNITISATAPFNNETQR